MKGKHLRISVLIVLALGVAAPARAQDLPPPPVEEPIFVAIYERGPAWVAGLPPMSQPKVHDHIMRFGALGERLIAAAPFEPEGDDPLVGIVVFRAASVEEAKEWLAADPMIVDGVMTGKIRRWLVDWVRSVGP